MRRRAVLTYFALSVGLVAGAAGPAAAHPGSLTSNVPLDAPSVVDLTVPSEEVAPMVAITVTVPPEYALSGATAPGWQAHVFGQVVELRGARLPVGQFADVTLRGRATARATLKIVVTTRSADGRTVAWDGPQRSPRPAVYVVAGFFRPPAASGSTSVSPVVWLILLAVAVLAATAVLVRRGRS